MSGLLSRGRCFFQGGNGVGDACLSSYRMSNLGSFSQDYALSVKFRRKCLFVVWMRCVSVRHGLKFDTVGHMYGGFTVATSGTSLLRPENYQILMKKCTHLRRVPM